jgi:MraZ protein
LGEFNRKVDERNRLSLPSELTDLFKPTEGNCLLIKERPGCISLWEQTTWKAKQDARIELIRQRLKIGDLEQRTSELQMFGRLLSTRERPVQIDPRGRFVLPEGFREFLGIEKSSEVMVVGAMVCIEIWNPQKWVAYVEETIPQFQKLITELSH